MIHARFINRFLALCLLLAAPTCKFAQPIADSPAQTRLALRAARLLDVRSGQMIKNPIILIAGERIKAVGPKVTIPADTKVIDLGDVTLLPGLIDAHTHISYHFDANGHFPPTGKNDPQLNLKNAAENAQNTLNAGFTTIRNLGAGDGTDLRLRDAIKKGAATGPRILASGEPITPNELFDITDQEARIQRLRDFVQQRIKDGVDVIKVFEGVDDRGKPLFSREEIAAVVEEAEGSGLKVAVHAHEASTIKAAVEGGCASIEHGSFLDDEAIRLLVKHHTALVPTLYLPTHYIDSKRQFAFSDSTWSFFEKLQSHNLDNLKRAKQAGVWIIMGSDAVAGVHGHNAREIIWLTKAGLTPTEAIQAATLEAARLLGIEKDAGEVVVNDYADIIAVPGDPQHDINTLEHVTFVMQGGRIIKNDSPKPSGTGD